jgi:hypothetical protein
VAEADMTRSQPRKKGWVAVVTALISGTAAVIAAVVQSDHQSPPDPDVYTAVKHAAADIEHLTPGSIGIWPSDVKDAIDRNSGGARFQVDFVDFTHYQVSDSRNDVVCLTVTVADSYVFAYAEAGVCAQ